MLMGTVMYAQPIFNLPNWIATLRPVYLHWITLGWLTQLIFGVAYWMFPKYSRENPRGNEKLGWAILLCLNVGLILRSIGEPLVMTQPEGGYGWTLALASLLLLLAGWGFVLNTWSRVKVH
jgi:hypothetical protein